VAFFLLAPKKSESKAEVASVKGLFKLRADRSRDRRDDCLMQNKRIVLTGPLDKDTAGRTGRGISDNFLGLEPTNRRTNYA